MEKNVYSISDYYIKARVEAGVCPLNWLAEFYREYDGKLVCLDNHLMSYLLNKAHHDEVKEIPYDGFKQTFTIIWNATEQYPETKVVISVYGREPIEQEENGEYVVDSVENYYIIEELKADDILVNNQEYAKDMSEDKQMLFLVGEELENKNTIV